MSKHPIQPLVTDEHGTVRFKANAIVRDLLDYSSRGGFGLNEIAVRAYNREDREQFAQLIGYSHEVLEAASRMLAHGETEQEARLKYLEELVTSISEPLRRAAVAAFSIHPDDLEPR